MINKIVADLTQVNWNLKWWFLLIQFESCTSTFPYGLLLANSLYSWFDSSFHTPYQIIDPGAAQCYTLSINLKIQAVLYWYKLYMVWLRAQMQEIGDIEAIGANGDKTNFNILTPSLSCRNIYFYCLCPL